MPNGELVLKVTKIVEGGQAIAAMPDGKKAFIWNALPGERVAVRVLRQKSAYAEAIAERIVTAAPERQLPKDKNFLSTSPWQIMTFEAENRYKKNIVEDVLNWHKLNIEVAHHVQTDNRAWQYRNKMEYSFWGDEGGLHLALHQRGSHAKEIVEGSALAMPAVDLAANTMCKQLNDLNIRAGSLKTIIVRAGQKNGAVASLFVKEEPFPALTLPAGLNGLRVYYSTPKSPASVKTRLLAEYGDVTLEDTLLGKKLTYDVDSFFQINVPVYEEALRAIRERLDADNVLDMYAGVGSIGLCSGAQYVEMVESDHASALMAVRNAQRLAMHATVHETMSEQAVTYITSELPVIFDPPRAGLHDKVVDRVLAAQPPRLVYLSCNPTTQARDLVRLQRSYVVSDFKIFNFFPRTPHIETLAVLERG